MELQLVVFTLDQEGFGVPIDQVQEIIRFAEITKIPKAPLSVMGVINLRGRVIPVIALRERFGFPAGDTDTSTRIIVADVEGQTVGFVVDSVTEVLRINDSTVEPAPATTTSVNTSFIKAIGKVKDRIIILLDLEKVFDFSSLQEPLAEAVS